MWRKAAKKTDLENGGVQEVLIEGESIALFRCDGKFYALKNQCLHRGGPLTLGHVEDGVVTCPWHAWQFDIKTGLCKTMEGAKQKCYATKLVSGEVLIDVDSATS